MYSGAEEGAFPRVFGQLLRIPASEYAEVLKDLDRLEDFYGHGDPRNQYERVEIACEVEGESEPVRAWTYICLLPPTVERKLVPHGDWRKYMTEGALEDAADDWAAKLEGASPKKILPGTECH